MWGSEGEKSTLFSIIWVSVTLFLRLLLETGLPFYIVIRPREGLAVCRDTAIPPFLSYFQTLSTGLAPWIEPTVSRFAVKRSTDWANPVVGGNASWRFCHCKFNTTRGEVRKLVCHVANDSILVYSSDAFCRGKCKGLFTWRWGNPPVHIISHFNLITFTW